MKSSEEIFNQKTNYRDLIFKLWRHKTWFAISLFFFLAASALFVKMSTPVFRNSTMLLLKESERNAFLRSQDMMQGFGLFGGNQNVENEVGILTSYSTIFDATNQLNLEVAFYTEEYMFGGLIKHSFFKEYEEIYTTQPLKISIDKSSLQFIDLPYYFTILNGEELTIEAEGSNVLIYDYLNDNVIGIEPYVKISGKFKFGEEIKGQNYSFKVHLKKGNNFLPTEKKAFFAFNSPSFLTLKYMDKLKANITSRTSSLVVISLDGENKYKITDFLNTMSDVYLQKNLEKKNRIAINTVKFIDSQISEVSDSLNYAESKLQSFRTSNRVMDISYQGQQSLERMSQLERERAVLIMQQKYYAYISEYFEKSKDLSDLVAPSSMNVQDPLLNQLIAQLIALSSERSNLLKQGNIKNLRLNTIEIQIDNLKRTINENIQSNAATTEIALQDINNRSARISAEMARLPSTERQLFGFERKFKLNDAIYTFLLQKRAEAQIARASNAPDYEIVDPARYITAYQIFPKNKLVLVIGFLLGLVIPFSIIVLRDFLNTKILSRKDLEAITSIPILGHVLHHDGKEKIVFSETFSSPVSESFRSIRTNLQFYASEANKQLIVVTSSYSGEGKSFVSQNLASVYALIGKKTLLIGFDLRRPKLFQDFNLSNSKGISTALIGQSTISDIIQKTSISNLDFIAAGPIPPNPLELIASAKTEKLINDLKDIYEYIIIDSPPIGIVSDGFLLMKFADANIFVVRQGYTTKDALATNINQLIQKNIPHVSLVINDVKLKSFSYDMGYDYSYYEETKKKEPFYKRLFSKSTKE